MERWIYKRAGGVQSGGESMTWLIMVGVGVLGVLVAAGAVWSAWAFNRLVRARHQMREGWSGIEVQPKRRPDRGGRIGAGCRDWPDRGPGGVVSGVAG